MQLEAEALGLAGARDVQLRKARLLCIVERRDLLTGEAIAVLALHLHQQQRGLRCVP